MDPVITTETETRIGDDFRSQVAARILERMWSVHSWHAVQGHVRDAAGTPFTKTMAQIAVQQADALIEALATPQ